jgi:hypothetical protein
MNDQDLMTAVKDAFADVEMRTPTVSVMARGNVLRMRRRLPLVAGAAALTTGAAIAVAVIAPAGQSTPRIQTAHRAHHGVRPAPDAPATLAAWTVTERPPGTVKVTIREMRDAAGLQAKLRADGVHVVVTASLAWPAACREWRAGSYSMGNRVLRIANQTGLPSANGTEFFIRPSAIPAGALLWLGFSQSGKPKGVVGPPGPMGSGYLRASQACIDS